MLDKNKRQLDRLGKVSIESGLLPSTDRLRDLIRFLNQAKTSRGKRVIRILEMMLEIEQMTGPISPTELIGTAQSQKISPKKHKLHGEIERRRVLLQKELSRYRFTPHAEVFVGGGGSGPSIWAVLWKAEDSGYEERLRLTAPDALEVILKLTQLGDLRRLRRCSQCHAWLFARFRHQAFCSTKCQQKNYTQGDAFKVRRRAYMRGYYEKNFSRK